MTCATGISQAANCRKRKRYAAAGFSLYEYRDVGRMHVDELIAEVGGDRRRGRERRANQSRSLPVYFYAFDLDYMTSQSRGLLARSFPAISSAILAATLGFARRSWQFASAFLLVWRHCR